MRPISLTKVLALLIMSAVGQIVCADVIKLNTGGEIRGDLKSEMVDPAAPVEITTLAGAKIQIAHENIDFVERRSRTVEEYVTRTRDLPHTVDAHWKMAEWCREHQLDDQRTEQLEAILELEPNHKGARRILDYVQYRGDWMTREEMMTQRGYVKHKGKWITQLELDLIEKSAAQREAETDWYPKVRLWLSWITSNSDRRKSEGLNNFEQLDDPNAVPALKQFMTKHGDPDVRLLSVSILAKMDGNAAVEALLERYLFDGHEAVRQHAIESLPAHQWEVAVPMLISALKNDGNNIINRAAVALGEMGDPMAVPHLIDALVTSHKYKVEVPTGNAMSFARGPGGRVSGGSSSSIPPEVEAMARTGQLPYGAVVMPHFANQQLTKTVTVRVEQKNPEVLAALEALTGQNYGFNERDWQIWYSLQKG